MPSNLAKLLFAGFALGAGGLLVLLLSASAEPPTGAPSATGGLTPAQRWAMYAMAAGSGAVGTGFVRFRDYIDATEGGRDISAAGSAAVGLCFLGFAGWLVLMAL